MDQEICSHQTSNHLRRPGRVAALLFFFKIIFFRPAVQASNKQPCLASAGSTPAPGLYVSRGVRTWSAGDSATLPGCPLGWCAVCLLSVPSQAPAPASTLWAELEGGLGPPLELKHWLGLAWSLYFGLAWLGLAWIFFSFTRHVSERAPLSLFN